MTELTRQHHRARRKENEQDQQGHAVQLQQENSVRGPHTSTGVREYTQVRYNDITIQGNGFGHFGNTSVYQSHLHVHHHYHGIPPYLQPESWVEDANAAALASVRGRTQYSPDILASESTLSALSKGPFSLATSSSLDSQPNNIPISYENIVKWLSSPEMSRCENKSIMDDSTEMVPSCPSNLAVLPTVSDDGSSEYSFTTCIERSDLPAPRIGTDHPWSSSEHHTRMVCAIDFGTTYTGIAWATSTLERTWGNLTQKRHAETFVCFVGETGAGKSTLVNSMIRKGLSWDFNDNSRLWGFQHQKDSQYQYEYMLALPPIRKDLIPELEIPILQEDYVGQHERLPIVAPSNLAPGQSQRAVSRLDLAKSCSVDASTRFRRSSLLCVFVLVSVLFLHGWCWRRSFAFYDLLEGWTFCNIT